MVVNFSLIGGNGDVISLDAGSDIVATAGLRGTGLVASELRVTQSAGDGGTWRGTRKGSRDIDLPVTVMGSSRDDVEAKLRRLANALSDRAGTPKLRIEYGDGSAWEIGVHYVAGAETTHGSDATNYFCSWAMTLQAPDPYWVSTSAQQFSVRATGETRGLLGAPVGTTKTLSALRVSSSQALGSLTIENTGDVDAFPTWIIRGPATNVAISLNGVGFEYTETLVAGDSITIDTRNATVTDATDANKYGALGVAPKLFLIPPGTSTLSIVAEGADTDTRILGNFSPRREVVY